jgi:hypothetical protein
VKTPLLTCLLAFGCHAALIAQQLKAPESLQPSTAPAADKAAASSAAEVEKLAEEAQKALFQSVDKSGGSSTTAKGASVAASTPMRLPAQRPENPGLWEKDSMRKIAVMDVAFGGTKHTVMFELFPNDDTADRGQLHRPLRQRILQRARLSPRHRRLPCSDRRSA